MENIKLCPHIRLYSLKFQVLYEYLTDYSITFYTLTNISFINYKYIVLLFNKYSETVFRELSFFFFYCDIKNCGEGITVALQLLSKNFLSNFLVSFKNI